jgi:hypothetical protein
MSKALMIALCSGALAGTVMAGNHGQHSEQGAKKACAVKADAGKAACDMKKAGAKKACTMKKRAEEKACEAKKACGEAKKACCTDDGSCKTDKACDAAEKAGGKMKAAEDNASEKAQEVRRKWWKFW